MGLRSAFRQTQKGIRIPYAGVQAGGANHGFVDLRGRPTEAAAIAEVAASRALGDLLVRLAAAASPVFTLGCDLGAHKEPTAPPRRCHIAGGYLHVVAAAYAQTTAQGYAAFAGGIERGLTKMVGNRAWEVAFLLQQVEMSLESPAPVRCPSLSICFYASAEKAAAAERSREALIRGIDDAIAAAAACVTVARTGAR